MKVNFLTVMMKVFSGHEKFLNFLLCTKYALQNKARSLAKRIQIGAHIFTQMFVP